MKFVDLYWFLLNLGPQPSSWTSAWGGGGRGTRSYWESLGSSLEGLACNFPYNFWLRGKRKVGELTRQVGKNMLVIHLCSSRLWLMSLGLLTAFALPAQPSPLAGTAGRGVRQGHKFCTVCLTLSRLRRHSLSQAILKKIHSWERNPGSAVSDFMLILI